MSINKVILIGHTGKAPDVKTFANGGVVAQFSLATTKKGYKTKDGKEIPERTEWHNIVLMNNLAKIAEQYVKKGDKLYIEGELRTRSYDDENSVKRYITEIYAYNMEMLSPKKDGQNNGQHMTAPTPPPPNPDDDLPF